MTAVRSGRTHQAAAALAAGMGIGRFVYTPVLPLMTAQAGLSAGSAAHLATANYLGYFAGAVAAVVRAPSRTAHRVALVLLVASLAGMPLTHSTAAWFALRLLAGVASALVFVAAVNAGAGRGMSGVGAGIALSGLVVLVWQQWQTAWWVAAAVSAVLALAAWPLTPGEPRVQAAGARKPGFAALFTAYTLEGVGYIIAGTFLVAAISGPLGSAAWVLAGLAAVLSPVLVRPRRHVLPIALAVQAAGIALPVLVDGTALVAVVLFGGTFLGIAATALGQGAELGFPRAAAVLTAGYSAGQVAGPLIAAPLLRHGYDKALLLAAAIVALAAITALAPLSRRPAGARTPRRTTPAAPGE